MNLDSGFGVPSRDENGEEIESDIGQLLNMIELKYDQHKITNTFREAEVEREFFKQSFKQKMELALVTVIEQALTWVLVVVCFQTYKLVKRPEYTLRQYFLTISLMSIILISASGLYLLCKRFHRLLYYYSSIQMIIFTITFFEMSFITEPYGERVDFAQIIVIIIASLALLSYNCLHLLCTMIICNIYIFTRSYFEFSDKFLYSRFVIFFLMSFVFIFMFFRVYNKNTRAVFVRTHQQRFIVGIFKRILRYSNEGILITKDDKIILCNQKFKDIFNIKEQKRKDEIIKILST